MKTGRYDNSETAPRAGQVSISTVMILAVSMIILLGIIAIADPLKQNENGLQAATEDRVQSLIDETEGGGSATEGHGPPGNPNDPPPPPPFGNEEEEEEEEEELNKEDPLPDGFAKALAEGMLNEALQHGLDLKTGEVAVAKAARDAAAGIRDAADLALQRALKNNAPEAEIRVLRSELQKAAQLLNAHRKTLGEVTSELTELNKAIDRAGKTAGTISALAELAEADKTAAQERKNGNYRESWRVTCAGAARFSAAVIANFGGRFSPNLKGVLQQYLVEKAADHLGRVAGDASFSYMVDLSHFLYRQPWWPKQIKPRFPPGYDGD